MDALYVVLILIGINGLSFTAFWWDKRLARAGAWRISESTLLWIAIAGGSLGAVIGQQLLRHKTRKEPFRTALCIIIAVQIAALAVWLISPEWIARLA